MGSLGATSISRALLSQVMGLLYLAPDIQEAILDLPRVARGPDPVTGRGLRAIPAVPEWRRQRGRWR